MVTVNVVVLAGTVAVEPIQVRRGYGAPTDGDGPQDVTEIRLSVPAEGQRLLPLPVVIPGDVGPEDIRKGDAVLVHGRIVRRFYRSGAGARSLTEVVASGVKVLERAAEEVGTF